MRKDGVALVKEATSLETLDLNAFRWQSNTLEEKMNMVASAEQGDGRSKMSQGYYLCWAGHSGIRMKMVKMFPRGYEHLTGYHRQEDVHPFGMT